MALGLGSDWSNADAFITLDTASDCHCPPTSFGDGCERAIDVGPTVRDAQKNVIKFDGMATIPMAAAMNDETQTLLKAKFRFGETVSKPILSLLEVMDNGAEFWLSRESVH